MAIFSAEGLGKCDARLFGEAFFPHLSLLVQLDLEKVIQVMSIKTERGYSSGLEST